MPQRPTRLEEIHQQLYPQGIEAARDASTAPQSGYAESQMDLLRMARRNRDRLAEVGAMTQPYYQFGGSTVNARPGGAAVTLGFSSFEGEPRGMYRGQTDYSPPLIEMSSTPEFLNVYRRSPEYLNESRLHETSHGAGQLMGVREYVDIANRMYPQDQIRGSQDHVLIYSSEFANANSAETRNAAKAMLERIIGRRLTPQEINQAAQTATRLLDERMPEFEQRAQALRQARAQRNLDALQRGD